MRQTNKRHNESRRPSRGPNSGPWRITKPGHRHKSEHEASNWFRIPEPRTSEVYGPVEDDEVGRRAYVSRTSRQEMRVLRFLPLSPCRFASERPWLFCRPATCVHGPAGAGSCQPIRYNVRGGVRTFATSPKRFAAARELSTRAALLGLMSGFWTSQVVKSSPTAATCCEDVASVRTPQRTL